LGEDKKLTADMSAVDERAKTAKAETEQVKEFMREAHGEYIPEILTPPAQNDVFNFRRDSFFKQRR
jgi:hypothetical protein